MRKRLLLSFLFLTLATLTLLTPVVQARFFWRPYGHVYRGYDKESVWFFCWEIQSWELWVTIDTSADTWNFKWKVNGGWPYTSFQYWNAQPYSYIRLWDDKGFSWSWGPYVIPAHALKGEITLKYSHSYTWTHTEVRWAYNVAPFKTDLKTCKVNMYVGS